MSVWRYCSHCGNGQDRITLDDIERDVYSDTSRVRCSHCDEERDDDTPYERFALLLEEVNRLRSILAPPQQ
ncbi:hypothetical protein FHT29_000031 [Rhizobium sp. SG741]|nr:hypothetical protein [Rhizobium sp. SG741]